MTTDRITRRTLLGSVGAVSLAPALHAEIGSSSDNPRAAAPSPHATAAFTLHLETGEAQAVAGSTDCWSAEVRGGRVTGLQLHGEVESGRIDFALDAEAGVVRASTRLIIRTPSGAHVELQDVAERTGRAKLQQLCGRCELMHGGVQRPALLVGRMDASALRSGKLSMSVFEVS
jgi:hypothetical protein